MNAAPGGELRAAGGLWGPPARALLEMLGRRYPEEHRPTWLSPGADQENSVLIGLLVAGWLTFRVAAPRLSPATTWGPSPANLIDANRPRGLTRDIYRTRSNRAFCARHKIRLSGPRLGRPKSDPDLVAEEKRQFIDDQRRRNAVEGKFGQGKRRFGLGLICEKLALTQGSTIAMNILVMNLEKLLELLFVLFTWWLHLLWASESVNNAHSDYFNQQHVMA